MRPKHRQSVSQLPLFTPTENLSPPQETPLYSVNIYSVTLVRESSVLLRSVKMRSSTEAAEIVRQYLKHTDREHFVVMFLNRKNALIGLNTVSVGSLTASVVHPREVFKPAILANAAAIICAHNHPSGDPQPSSEDRVLTKRLVEAGKLLGIEVLDHIIVGDHTDAYFSFADNNLLA